MFVIVLAPVKMEKDPRHLWWVDSLMKKGLDVTFFENLSHKPYVLDKNLGKFLDYKLDLRSLENNVEGYSVQVSQKFSIENFRCVDSGISNNRFIQIIDELLTTSKSLPSLYSIHQILRISAGLNLIKKQELSALVVANDLVCAAAALLALGTKSSSIVYDAQEIFTDMWDVSTLGSLTNSERMLWVELETIVCQSVEKVVTISPGAANLYFERHGVNPTVMPNYLPVSSHKEKFETTKKARLVFMGNFAPHRGIDLLVEEWSQANTEGMSLDLYIPFSSGLGKIRKLIKKHKPRNFRLLPGVSEDKMLFTLSQYDAGIIPYDYPYPYDQCSPNKFGQYISQGLCVLSNNQDFLKSEIETFNLGTVFDWDQVSTFQAALDSIKNVDDLNSFRENVRNAFIKELNWDTYFEKLWDQLIEKSELQSTELDVSLQDLLFNADTGTKIAQTSRIKNFMYRSLVLLDVYGDSRRSRYFRRLLESKTFKVLISPFSQKFL